MKKKKILHLIKSLGRGGAEMLLAETLKFHDRSMFEFHYGYFLPWKDNMVESIQQNGGVVVCFNASNNVYLMLKAWKVCRYVRKNNIQLIHAHLPWAGVLARVVGKMSGVPVIYTEHNKQERYHAITRIMNLYTMNLLQKIIAVSDDVSKSIRKNKSNLKVPIQIILNGVDTGQFTPGFFSNSVIREKYNIPLDAPVVGTIAVFRFQKRLEIWLELARGIVDPTFILS
jgi:L-malate glycosyltransferase